MAITQKSTFRSVASITAVTARHILGCLKKREKFVECFDELQLKNIAKNLIRIQNLA
jgi:hypothetical protein